MNHISYAFGEVPEEVIQKAVEEKESFRIDGGSSVYEQLRLQLTDDSRFLRTQRIKTTTELLSKFYITRIPITLKKEVDIPEGPHRQVDCISFAPILLKNVECNGDENDGGETYRRLTELANDKKMLVSSVGPYLGNILYYAFPTWLKAKVYTDGMKKAIAEGMPMGDWMMTNNDGETVGTLGLTKIDNEKYTLDGKWDGKNLYNVGVLLHSKFQRRGLMTQISRALMKRIASADIDIDGFFIYTRTDNVGVNKLARSIGFEYEGEQTVKIEGILSYLLSSITSNVYVMESFLGKSSQKHSSVETLETEN